MDHSLSKLLAEVDINFNLDTGPKRSGSTEAEDYWNGGQTEADRQKSVEFLNTLRHKKSLICPYCRTRELVSANDDHLVCLYCSYRVWTKMSVEEIIVKVEAILKRHQSSGCADQFPQWAMFSQNLIVYCDVCPFKMLVLQ